jgi:hypothetical protein
VFRAWDQNGMNIEYFLCEFERIYVSDVSNLLDDFVV